MKRWAADRFRNRWMALLIVLAILDGVLVSISFGCFVVMLTASEPRPALVWTSIGIGAVWLPLAWALRWYAVLIAREADHA